jgi:hypothetical protein
MGTPVMHGSRQLDQVHQRENTLVAVGCLSLKSETDIIRNCQVRKQGAILRDNANATTMRGNSGGTVRHYRTVENNAAAIGSFKTGDKAQKRRLARSGWADNGRTATGYNIKADIIDRLNLAVALADSLYGEKTHCPAIRFDCV